MSDMNTEPRQCQLLIHALGKLQTTLALADARLALIPVSFFRRPTHNLWMKPRRDILLPSYQPGTWQLGAAPYLPINTGKFFGDCRNRSV